MAREAVKDFQGKILGYIEIMPNGDKRVTNFMGTTLGFYRKFQNVTTDFYGKILYRGDMCGSLIK